MEVTALFAIGPVRQIEKTKDGQSSQRGHSSRRDCSSLCSCTDGVCFEVRKDHEAPQWRPSRTEVTRKLVRWSFRETEIEIYILQRAGKKH